MKKLKKILLLSPLLVLMGCSTKSNPKLNQYVKYEQNLLYTKVATLSLANNSLVSMNITYLNSSNSKKYNNIYQNFVVTLYSEDNVQIDPKKLTMNNNDLLKITKIDKKSPLYQNVAVKNNWSNYYLIQFSNTKHKYINLKYTYDIDHILNIDFIKE